MTVLAGMLTPIASVEVLTTTGMLPLRYDSSTVRRSPGNRSALWKATPRSSVATKSCWRADASLSSIPRMAASALRRSRLDASSFASRSESGFVAAKTSTCSPASVSDLTTWQSNSSALSAPTPARVSTASDPPGRVRYLSVPSRRHTPSLAGWAGPDSQENLLRAIRPNGWAKG